MTMKQLKAKELYIVSDNISRQHVIFAEDYNYMRNNYFIGFIEVIYKGHLDDVKYKLARKQIHIITKEEVHGEIENIPYTALIK